MPKYTLTYFDGKGRAELVRLVFAQAGVEYTDKRVTGEEWGAMKEGSLFGMLPQLEIEGGVVLGESLVIAQYLAEEFGFGGESNLDRARVRMVVQNLDELMVKFFAAMFEKDDARKATLQTDLNEKIIPRIFGRLEALLKTNNGGEGFFFGSSVTTADLQLLNMGSIVVDQLAKYPVLHGLYKRVEALPKIAAWLAKRPETKF